MEKIKNLFGDNLPAFLYGIIITIVTLILYIPNNYIVILIATAAVGILYIVLNRVNEKAKKALCVSLYLVAFLIVFFSFRLNIAGTGFYMWLLTGYEYNALFIPYIALLFVTCILFFGVSSYYFTTFYFRGYIMIFMLMIPIALYYKTIEAVPVVYIMAIVASIIYLYIVQQQKRNLKGKKILITSAFRKFLLSILIAIIVIVAVVPKSDTAPKRETFDEIIAMNPFSNKNINAIASLSEKSAAATYGYLNQSKVLYTLNAYEPLYLRRSSYESFKGEYFENENVAEYSDWRDTVTDHNMRSFYENMMALYDKYPDVFELYNITSEDIPNVTEESMTAVITPKNFNANYFITPVRTFDLKTNDSYRKVLKNNKGAIYYERRKDVGLTSYTIEYYRDIARENEEILNFARKFTIYQYYSFINELESKEIEGAGEYTQWLNDILTEIAAAFRYNRANADYSERIKELAENITKDYDTDYEKAQAIERYFRDNDYVYNISYEPDEPGIEYFIFNSKEGGCREYATAMTLMAQSVEICARYTEGFMATKKYDDGTYYITAGNSHAYVEVYIPGYGFTVFEPTVASTESDIAGTISDTISRFTGVIEMTKDNVIYFVIIGIAAVIIVLLFKLLLIDIIRNKIMVAKCKKSRQSAFLAYRYIQKMILPYTEKNVEAMTPIQIRDFYKKNFDIDISELTESVEKRAYGGMECGISKQFINKLPEFKKIIREKVKNSKKAK